jgi:putative endonuclease
LSAAMMSRRRCGIEGRTIDFVPNAVRDPYRVDTVLGSKIMFFVYILASLSGTLYVGLTDDLRRRVEEHKLGLVDSFTKKYNVNRLMYYETCHDSKIAENRERQIKKWRREKKIALFAKTNPRWEYLSTRLSGSFRVVLM